jgi:hypothetical protein
MDARFQMRSPSARISMSHTMSCATKRLNMTTRPNPLRVKVGCQDAHDIYGPSSATPPTGGFDCKLGAMADFAAAHRGWAA